MINCALKGDRNMDLHIKVWDFGVVCVFVIAKKVQIKHLHGVSSDNVCFFLQFHWTSSHFIILHPGFVFFVFIPWVLDILMKKSIKFSREPFAY